MAIDPRNYPHLVSEGFTETSPCCKYYNCIAWAIREDKENWWWPPGGRGSYWPSHAPKSATMRSFSEMIVGEGFEECETGTFEEGYIKVALYAGPGGNPTHAARQLASGKWTHKIGKNVDIETTLRGVEESLTGYGTVVKYFRRKSAD